ncbi:AAA domain-containing protein [Anaerocolumna sp. AGMB13025]|uniref:serine/threonine-protein kinase n=1 Tax=Anaerocolumna sp. AGMB13025 TaxID=3039116 RepID=UPI00241C41BC|nr:serine/threonine-protein kinase [Anaerocolumna sp. AGMB13025]WFR59892.1 AAA domain-containing protein [Anaerocolumna sp. AGMB13025]
MDNSKTIDNYEVIEIKHTSEHGNTVIAKVKEKFKEKCERVYALKLIGPLDNRLEKLMFKREIEALKILNSCKNIVKIRDHLINISFAKNRNWGAILLDYVYGDNLEELDMNDFSQVKKYEICLKILYAVSEAHNNNVLHRDIKPSNIMYNEETGEVILIDFGTSKIKTIIEKETTFPFYSKNYSAPEVILGNDTTEASDIFSIGAVMFKIFFGIDPNGSQMMIDTMKDMRIFEDLYVLIKGMIEVEPKNRFQNIDEIIDKLKDIIGENISERENFICLVDSDKLEYLKKINLVESDINMTIFTKSYLKYQFRRLTGFYDKKEDVYFFTGKKVALESIYNKESELFETVRILPLSLDRKVRFDKKGFEITGNIQFVNSYEAKRGRASLGYNNNDRLVVKFKNSSSEQYEVQKQDELFDELFGKWQEGLDESIVNEKEKSGRVLLSGYSIEEKQLLVKLEKYYNNDLDELNSETRYIVEDVDNKGNPVYVDVGSFNSVRYEEDSTIFVIDLVKKIILGKVKRILTNKKILLEDFRANISSYKRQIYALRALHDDSYSSKNLKDILLNLDIPTATPTLSNISFSSDEFDVSQKEAVCKAIYTDSISLIQGPPGTGKTKVIREIITQIVQQVEITDDVCRILIVSQSHTAVDNIIEGLNNNIKTGIDIIRIGKEKDISKSVAQKYTLSAIRKEIFDKIQESSESYICTQDEIYKSVEDKKEQERWASIKEIQKDWLNRCSNFETLDSQVIKSATIIAGTCVGFLSNSFVKELDFDYVIIDEAAKSTTPELLVSIIKAKKIVLVGDQNQLPAYADKKLSPTIAKLTREPSFRLFDILFNILPDTHKQVLTLQYRMIRNIGNLISQVFYQGKIATGVEDKRKIHSIKMFEGKSIIWINTSMMKDKNEKPKKGGSFCNYAENTIVRKLLEQLNKDGDLSNLDIGIITGYRGQMELITRTVTNNGYDKIAKMIDINTLDAFQGRENDIIIYSTVRTKNSIGFQKEKERVNVAFSRAKKLLIICGDMDFFYHFDHPENKFVEIIDYIYEHNDKCKIMPGGDL